MRAQYHFTALQRRIDMLNASGTPDAFGQFLHAEQDSFSHEGYGPTWGHASAGHGGHAPDWTYTDPEKADRMAVDTYSYLLAGKFSRDALPINLSEIAPFIQAFNRAKNKKDKATQINNIRHYVEQHRKPAEQKKGSRGTTIPGFCSAQFASCDGGL